MIAVSAMDTPALQAEVVRLRGMIAEAIEDFPREWDLTTKECAVFRVLLAHDVPGTALIVEGARCAHSSVKVHIFNIRLKVEQHKVEIETVSGKGWRLVDRDFWRRSLAAPNQGVQ